MEIKLKNEVTALVKKEIEAHFPKKDFIELKMNMETVMRHTAKDKKDREDNAVLMSSISSTLQNIEKSLIPHSLNNNKGLISEFADAKIEIERLKGVQKVHRVYFALLGFLIVGSGVIGHYTKPILKEQTEKDK
ncbi:hypothetical protein [Flavobacterium sp.]|uniref:hypothetical protein n=1 Tax=Flavobacterium sp. TaxID=239 RepID=UPI0038FD11F9